MNWRAANEYAADIRLSVSIDGKAEDRLFPKRDQFAPELIYFSNCILENREPEPGGEEGLIDVQIIRAAYRSAEVGRAVPVQANHAAPRPEPAQQIHCPPAEEPQLLHAELPSGSSNQ